MSTNDREKLLNVVFYMSDQHRWDYMGAYGNKHIQTPNMDRFAETGIRFNHMFSPYPLCGPARACYITGQYPQAHMARFNGLPVPINNPRLPRTLKENGYHTGIVGIIDLEPRKGKYHGYERYEYKNGYDKWAREHGIDDPGKWQSPEKAHDYGSLDQPAEYHFSSWVAEKSMDIIEEWHDSDKPFFLRVGERIPHPPYYAPSPYDKMYDPEEIPLDPAVNPEREDYQLLKEATAMYCGLVSLVDYNFGRILNKIDELGLTENTIVIYCSDH